MNQHEMLERQANLNFSLMMSGSASMEWMMASANWFQIHKIPKFQTFEFLNFRILHRTVIIFHQSTQSNPLIKQSANQAINSNKWN